MRFKRRSEYYDTAYRFTTTTNKYHSVHEKILYRQRKAFCWVCNKRIPLVIRVSCQNMPRCHPMQFPGACLRLSHGRRVRLVQSFVVNCLIAVIDLEGMHRNGRPMLICCGKLEHVTIPTWQDRMLWTSSRRKNVLKRRQAKTMLWWQD